MRLLIVTQAVDLDDPVLGFFHRWIEEFAKHVESLEVICLKRGRFNLPPNVSVHSLGKEEYKGRAFVRRIRYALRFYKLIFQLRNRYDAVFVHMNPEYVVLGGFLWRLWRKRIALWFIHPRRSFSLRIASLFAHVILSATPKSVPIRTRKVLPVGLGIDTNAFAPLSIAQRGRTILSLGRLDAVKKIDVLVEALAALHEENISFHADIYGTPTDPKSNYAHDVRNAMAPLSLEGVLQLHEAVPNDQTPALYRAHAVFVNLTETGSFDKAIAEALASGCIVVAANESLRGAIPEAFMSDGTIEGTAQAIKAALEMAPKEQADISARNRAYAEEHFSLQKLIPRIVAALQ